MANFVLVHGMWHGGWCWKRVTPALRHAGHAAYAVTLSGLGERRHLRAPGIDLDTHIQDVVNVLEFEDLTGVVLVGHSIGGLLAQAVAERVPQRMAHLVNIDGPRAVDGKAIKDMLPEMWQRFRQRAQAEGDPDWISPPPGWDFGVKDATDRRWLWSRLTAHPLRTWETPLVWRNPAALSIPRTYVVCTGDSTSGEIAARRAAWHAPGWRLETLPTGHDAMISMPHELVELLRSLV